MQEISRSLTTAPGITVFPPTAAVTLAGAGSAMPCAAVAVLEKGPVGKPFKVTSKTLTNRCGRIFPRSEGDWTEGIRHIKDALTVCEHAYVVRVAPSDAKFPSITFMLDAVDGDEAAVAVAHSYGTEVAMADSAWLTLFPENGDPNIGTKVDVTVTDADAGLFSILFTYADETTLTVEGSVDPEATDDNGQSIYLPSILKEGENDYGYTAYVKPNADLNTVGLLSAEFTDGTNGTLTSLVADDYSNAWALLDNWDLDWRVAFAAGIYESAALHAAYAVCEKRMAGFFWDAPTYMTQEEALAWGEANGPAGIFSRFHHYNYLVDDDVFQGRTHWGVSGRMAANAAKVVQKPTGHAAVSGHFYVPAGQVDGAIGRGNPELITPNGAASGDQLVAGRMNTTAKGLYNNDCLAFWSKQDPFRFMQTSTTIAAMSFELAAALDSLRFQPVSNLQTTVEELANELAERYNSAGALVKPKGIDSQYYIEVTVPEEDYIHVEIGLKVTGVARRFGIQFRQMR